MREAIERGALLSDGPLRQVVLRFATAGFLRVQLGIIMFFFSFWVSWDYYYNGGGEMTLG